MSRSGLDDLAALLGLAELVIVQVLAVQLLVVLLADAGHALVQGQVHRVHGLACGAMACQSIIISKRQLAHTAKPGDRKGVPCSLLGDGIGS